MKLLQEGPLANFLSRLIDLVLLNVLWFLSSLPIFTLGASTCAVYDVTMRWAAGGEPPVIKTYMHAFRKNMKKASALFFLFSACGLFFLLDFWCAVQWKSRVQFLVIVVILAAFYFYLAVLSHAFALLAYFDTGIKETIIKSFLLSMRNGVFTVFIMLINLLPYLAVMMFPGYFGEILFLYITLGFSTAALLNSLHLVRLFEKYTLDRQ